MRDGRRLASSGTAFSQGEAIPLVDVERVSLRASCPQDARRELERGVALLHGLWQEAAYAAFTVAAERDPRCVLAYWGQAMSALPAPADLEPQLDLDRGRAAVEWAQAIPDGTSRERAYIDTVAAFFDPPAVALPARLMRHSRAMRALAQDHPDDNEAAAFYARALLALQSGSRQDNQRRAAAWLRARFGDRPNHPGAAHYLVLAYDNPADAGKGLAAADHFARLAPPVPRARHTVSHIYTRLGLFEEAARADEAAWAAWQAIKARAGDSDESREAMRYGYHSLVSLLYARLQLGQVAHATALLYQARAAAGLPGAGPFLVEMETRYALERGLWNQVLDLPSPAPRSKPDDSFLYARGIAAARAAWPGGREAELGLARAAADSLDRDALNRPADRDRIEAEGAAVRATVAAAIEERGEMTVMLAHARALDEARPHPSPLAHPLLPIHELAGDLWLQVSRYDRAARDYRAALVRHPRRARALHGLARAALREGDRQVAAEAATALLALWANADPDLPELEEARSIAAQP